MKRFGKVALNIQNLKLDVALHHLDIALQPGLFVICARNLWSL